MIEIKERAHIHFYVDIDGLIINLITFEINKDELSEHHKIVHLFEYCIQEDLIDLDSIKLMMNIDSRLMGFSTIEGQVQVDISKYKNL